MAQADLDPFLDGVIDRWRDAGVAYDGPALDGKPAPAPPLDLERLLLDSARAMRHVARLYNTTATWLHDFGDIVAKHRLRRLIVDELGADDHAPLGAVLDCARIEPLLVRDATQRRELGAHFFCACAFFLGGFFLRKPSLY